MSTIADTKPKKVVRRRVKKKAPEPTPKLKNHKLIKIIRQHFGMDFSTGTHKLSKRHPKKGWKTRTNQYPFNDAMLDQHIEGEHVLHTTRYSKAPVLIIDVDHHDSMIPESHIIAIIDQLVSDLGEPMYIERSHENGGYHLWWRFDGYIDNEKMHNLPYIYANNYGMTIEVIDGGRTLRFPLSIQYNQYCGKYSSAEPDRVEILSNDEIIDYFNSDFVASLVPTIVAQDNVTTLSKPAPKVTATRKIDADSDTTVSTNQFNKYAYGAGTRYINQVRLAMAMAWRGYEYEDYRDMAQTLDHGSRDMKRWSSSLIDRTLRRYWESALDKAVSDDGYVETKANDTPDEWQMRDGDFLPDREVYRQVLEVIAERELKYKRSEFVESSLKVLNAIYENIDFRKKYEYSYRNKIFGHLRGASLSKDMWEKLAYKLKVKNIRRIKKILIDYNVLNVEKDANGREYNYHKIRRAKHFLVESAEVLYAQYEQPEVKKANNAIVEIGTEIMETVRPFQQPKTVAELFDMKKSNVLLSA